VKKPVIFNIQKFSVHDGPGIRSTVFFKGCPIRCKWCHNPESQNYHAELMKNKDGVEETIGKEYPIKELVNELLKDQLFYDQSGGGVTFSGGEVMTQPQHYVVETARRLHGRGINLAIDTCGVAPEENFAKILPFADLFLYDLKFTSSQLHEKYTGIGNELVLSNLKYLSEKNANIQLRLIMLEGLNADDQSIQDVVDWLRENNVNVVGISLLPYHKLGKDKYERLNRKVELFETPTDERMAEIKRYFENKGYLTTIGA